MSWLLLTLICAFTLASSDAAAKRWFGGRGAWDMVLGQLRVSFE